LPLLSACRWLKAGSLLDTVLIVVLLFIRILSRLRVWLRLFSALYVVVGWPVDKVIFDASLEVSIVRWLHGGTLL
jgi:hypothetical protein